MIDLVVFGFGIMAIVVIVLIIFMANVYDIRSTWQQQKFLAHPGMRQFRNRPIVSIILTSADDLQATKTTLNSLMKISYRNRKIIVVGAKKSDFKPISQYKSVRFVKNRQTIGQDRAELTLEIYGGMAVDEFSVSRAVWHFNNNPGVSAVVLASCPQFYPSMPHLFATYHSLVSMLVQKSLSIFGHTTADQANLIMRKREILTADKSQMIVYADNALFTHLPVRNFDMLLKMQQLKKWRSSFVQTFMSALLISTTYAIYSAVWLHQPTLLTFSILGLTLLLGAAIWLNNHIAWINKCIYSIAMPVSMVYFYIALVMQVLKTFTDMTKAILPVGIGLFVRVKNVFGIVK